MLLQVLASPHFLKLVRSFLPECMTISSKLILSRVMIIDLILRQLFQINIRLNLFQNKIIMARWLRIYKVELFSWLDKKKSFTISSQI